jgi:hypothetical protein
VVLPMSSRGHVRRVGGGLFRRGATGDEEFLHVAAEDCSDHREGFLDGKIFRRIGGAGGRVLAAVVISAEHASHLEEPRALGRRGSSKPVDGGALGLQWL